MTCEMNNSCLVCSRKINNPMQSMKGWISCCAGQVRCNNKSQLSLQGSNKVQAKDLILFGTINSFLSLVCIVLWEISTQCCLFAVNQKQKEMPWSLNAIKSYGRDLTSTLAPPRPTPSGPGTFTTARWVYVVQVIGLICKEIFPCSLIYHPLKLTEVLLFILIGFWIWLLMVDN